jgi:hypothetical protein
MARRVKNGPLSRRYGLRSSKPVPMFELRLAVGNLWTAIALI